MTMGSLTRPSCSTLFAGGDIQVIRREVVLVLQALIEAEGAEVIGATRYGRTEGRTTWRNGVRGRMLATKAGDVELQIPKLRSGTFFLTGSRFALVLRVPIRTCRSASTCLGPGPDYGATLWANPSLDFAGYERHSGLVLRCAIPTSTETDSCQALGDSTVAELVFCGLTTGARRVAVRFMMVRCLLFG